MQVLFVQSMHLAREIRPIEAPRELATQLGDVAFRTIAREFDLPSTEVVQQPHVRLDEDVQAP